MLKSSVLIFTLIILLKLNSINAEKYKNCSIYDAREFCPNNAKCLQETNETSYCKCDNDYIFNQNYKNDTDYCIYNPIILKTSSTSKITLSSSSSSSPSSPSSGTSSVKLYNDNRSLSFYNKNNKMDNDNESSRSSMLSSSLNGSNKTSSTISVNQSPSLGDSSHIIGGILIPIFLVIVVLGLAYGIKRLNIVKRIRDVMITRNNRPFYEDVMMSNDNDDPPLI